MTTGVRPTRAGWLLAACVAAGAVVLAGCAGRGKGPDPTPAGDTKATTKAPTADSHAAEIKDERDKLSPEDRTLVDAQEWCVVSTDSRLGSMGPPIKLTVKDQPVFICCKGCQKKALADPDRTLAAVAELKVKANAGREKP